METTINFSDEQCAELFGHEAAENEDPDRLRQYYFKSDTFARVTADLPLRVLVGHKGIGKSALFQIAIHEDEDADRLPVEIRPDDVTSIALESTNLLQQISSWKAGLYDIITQKVLARLTDGATSVSGRAGQQGLRILGTLVETLKPLLATKVDLAPAKKQVIQFFLDRQKIVVYMDDLDRGWKGRPEDISRISALLNAVRDLSRDNPGVQFRLSLRSDVYFLARTSDESTDKIESSVVWHSWTNHHILAMLVKRIETYFGRQVTEAYLTDMVPAQLGGKLSVVMDDRFQGEGKWKNAPMYRILMSLIRRRPRDLVKLLHLAGGEARRDRSNKIQTAHFRAIFEKYSQDRIQDTVNEYRSELPDVERLLLGMKPNRRERQARTGYYYKTDELLDRIKSIMETGAFRDAGGRLLTPKQLAGFMYKVNMIIASKEKESGFIDRRYFEENRYLSSEIVDFGYAWEVHPAYRWALQPDRLEDIFEKLGLSEED